MPEPKPKRKRIRNRYDSTYRSLLRRYRKWYQKIFNAYTSYNFLKRRKPNSFFFECVRSFCQGHFGENCSETLLFTVSCLVSSKSVEKLKDQSSSEFSQTWRDLYLQNKERIKQLEIVFKIFSFSRMEEAIGHHEHHILLSLFIRQNEASMTPSEKYACEQMLNISSNSNLLGA